MATGLRRGVWDQAGLRFRLVVRVLGKGRFGVGHMLTYLYMKMKIQMKRHMDIHTYVHRNIFAYTYTYMYT